MSAIWETITTYFRQYFTIVQVSVSDVIEMVIIAVIFYEIMIWFKKTRAWALFKGILIILVAILLSAIFQFNTILWVASKTLSVGLLAIVVLFQPEFRRALEQIGRGRFFRKTLGFGKNKTRITDENIDQILEAVETMSNSHTGALICLERDIALGEYENTGIRLDSQISKALLVNIFEDKTPLHDGAVIIKEDRLTAATCYLPMSELKLNKRYGTRHRAALGLSEVTDALTIVVSEETGEVSIAVSGELIEHVSHADLKNKLLEFQTSAEDGESLIEKIKKGKKNDEAESISSEVDSE